MEGAGLYGMGWDGMGWDREETGMGSDRLGLGIGKGDGAERGWRGDGQGTRGGMEEWDKTTGGDTLDCTIVFPALHFVHYLLSALDTSTMQKSWGY